MTVHVTAARRYLDRLTGTVEGTAVLHGVYSGLRQGRWSGDYMDSIGQHGIRTRTSWPMEQVAAFGWVHLLVASGKAAMVTIGTGGAEPRRDSRREENAAALAGLPHPFTASVDMEQNNGDFDGTLSWSEPIEVTASSGFTEQGPGGSVEPIPMHFMIPPGEASLEIGSSLPSRTMMHLFESGSVARWPYGHPRMRLFVYLDWEKDREAAALYLEPHPEQALAPRPPGDPWSRESVARVCEALGHPRRISYTEHLETLDAINAPS